MSQVDRRGVIVGAGALALAAGLPRAAKAAGSPVDLIVGTYHSEGGKGLYPLRYQPLGDRLVLGEAVEAIGNASFGVRSSRFGLHYLLDEKAQGGVAAYRGATDGWRAHAVVATGGADPCHAALDARQTCVAIANYSSGGLSFFRLDPRTGFPIAPPQLFANSGHGPNRERQEAPHAHWVGFSPDQRWLYQVDLGTDAVLAFPFDATNASLGARRIAYQAPGGTGPRHLLLHTRLATAYLVAELSNRVIVLDRNADGSLRERRSLPLLPDGFTGHSQAAHIATNRAGTRLYVSNRGHDSIAVFAIDRRGELKLLQHVATGGSWPRFFLLLEDQRRLLVANERAGELRLFAVAPDGRLSATGRRVAVPGAVFVGAA